MVVAAPATIGEPEVEAANVVVVVAAGAVATFNDPESTAGFCGVPAEEFPSVAPVSLPPPPQAANNAADIPLRIAHGAGFREAGGGVATGPALAAQSGSLTSFIVNNLCKWCPNVRA